MTIPPTTYLGGATIHADTPRSPRIDRTTRAALYARVSTTEQSPAGQLDTLRAFAEARGWHAREFVDHGVSAAKERRPALDALMGAARARTVDIVACVKLDRLARSTHHLVTLARQFEALGVELVVLDQAIDTTTPAGRLLFHVLAAIAEFERGLIRERVVAGVRRARAQGRPMRSVWSGFRFTAVTRVVVTLYSGYGRPAAASSSVGARITPRLCRTKNGFPRGRANGEPSSTPTSSPGKPERRRIAPRKY